MFLMMWLTVKDYLNRSGLILIIKKKTKWHFFLIKMIDVVDLVT